MDRIEGGRTGAEQTILMGRHKVRTDLGREFGATDVVAARGEEGIAQVRQLTTSASPGTSLPISSCKAG